MALAPQLGFAVSRDQSQLVQDVRRALGQRERFLLIFDNAEEPAAIEQYLPQSDRRNVLITTRRQTWPYAVSERIREMSEDEATAFVLERVTAEGVEPAANAPERKQAACDAARQISRVLGGLPLALEQAVAYMVSARATLSEYAVLLEGCKLRVLEEGRAHDYSATVATTWLMALDRIAIEVPHAIELLNCCSVLAPDAISLRDLRAAHQHLPASLAIVVSDDLSLNRSKAALLRYSLIHAEGQQLSVHRLVQDVTRSLMGKELLDSWRRGGYAR